MEYDLFDPLLKGSLSDHGSYSLRCCNVIGLFQICRNILLKRIGGNQSHTSLIINDLSIHVHVAPEYSKTRS